MRPVRSLRFWLKGGEGTITASWGICPILSVLVVSVAKNEDANTSCTDQLAQVGRSSSKETLNVTLYNVTDLVESVTMTWSLSLSASIPWMPEFGRVWPGTSPHNVYPSYSAAMLDDKKVELVESREKRHQQFVSGHETVDLFLVGPNSEANPINANASERVNECVSDQIPGGPD